MPRVKRGITAAKRRRKILKQTKGYRWGRKSKERSAKQALMKAGAYAYRDRRVKKRDFRRLWQIKINAGARDNDTTYGRLMASLKKGGIKLDRKILAELAEKEPEVFREIVKTSLGSSRKSSE